MIWRNFYLHKYVKYRVLANKFLHTEYGVYLKLYGLFDDWNVKDWCGSTIRQEKSNSKESGCLKMITENLLNANDNKKKTNKITDKQKNRGKVFNITQ